MKIYVVGSSKNKFLPLDNIREKFLIDQKHEGDNIDFLNPWYCELTGLYYLWKHCDDDIVGLEHYRRYFVNEKGNLLSENEIRNILKDYDVICPIHYNKPNIRSMIYPKDVYERFEKLGEKIYGLDFFNCCEEVLNSNYMCLCNMFISNKDYVNEYCEFVFNWCKIYTEFEKSCHNEIPPRMFGYLTETFTRAYLLFKNKKIKFNRIVFKPSFK